jgi:hypothetical protein
MEAHETPRKDGRRTARSTATEEYAKEKCMSFDC